MLPSSPLAFARIIGPEMLRQFQPLPLVIGANTRGKGKDRTRNKVAVLEDGEIHQQISLAQIGLGGCLKT